MPENTPVPQPSSSKESPGAVASSTAGYHRLCFRGDVRGDLRDGQIADDASCHWALFRGAGSTSSRSMAKRSAMRRAARPSP